MKTFLSPFSSSATTIPRYEKASRFRQSVCQTFFVYDNHGDAIEASLKKRGIPGTLIDITKDTMDPTCIQAVIATGGGAEIMNHTAFTVPIEVISELNWRGHYMARHQRLKKHKELAYASCLAHGGHRQKWKPRTAITVILTRIKGPRQRDFDSDNLAAAFKGTRDGIAKYLGIDDGSVHLEWRYGQAKGRRPGVMVEIRQGEDEFGST